MLFSLKHTLCGHRGAIYALAYVPGTGLLSAGGDGIVALWNPQSGENQGALAMLPAAVFSLCMSAEGRYLLAGTEKSAIHVLDLSLHKEIHNLSYLGGGIFQLGILPAAQGYYALGGNGVLAFINPDFSLRERIKISETKLRTAAWQGENLWLGDSAGVITELSAGSHNILRSWQAHNPSVYGLVFSGEDLYTSGRDGHIRKWDLKGTLQWEIAAHNYAVYRLLQLPGAMLASASRDRKIKFWSAVDGSFAGRIDRAAGGHRASINALLCIPELQLLVSGSDDKEIKIWQSA